MNQPPFMRTMPHWIDRGKWMHDDPKGYFAFARMLSAREAAWQLRRIRINTHRADAA